MAQYPGAEYNMSVYGLKLYNPEEEKRQWVNSCKVGLRRFSSNIDGMLWQYIGILNHVMPGIKTL